MKHPPQQGFARTNDGLEIFHRSIGQGEPALVCCNGIGVSTFFWEYLVDHFAPDHQVVLWDYRGHGRSSDVGPRDRVDIPRMAWDLGTVIDELELKQPVLLGHSMGTQVILEYYRQAPSKVGGLVSVLGTYGHPLDTFNNLRFSRQIFDLVLALNEGFPRLTDAVQKFLISQPAAYRLGRWMSLVDGSRLSRHDLQQYFRHLTDIGFPLFFRIVREMGEHTARDLLPQIVAPALVIAAEFDAFTPPGLARELNDGLPDSEIVELHGASHAGIVEQPEQINEFVAGFLAGRVRRFREQQPT
ncbi:MAG: alpha/beta hydrolase [Myxococcota bacterium]|nr:alpha/beta hydrolase [Myxococcota bacterium]